MSSTPEPALQTRLRAIGLWAGPAAFLGLLLFFHPEGAKPGVGPMAAIVALMAIWWLSEAVPLAVTALLPIAFFPLFGVATPLQVTNQYFNPIIALFLGAFLIALSMERWNLHRRIALNVISRVGSSPRQLVSGFLAASALLSMWISNTATATMMLPIAMAVIARAEETLSGDAARRLSVALLLSVAYGASIGGVATLVGTPTNLALVQIFQTTFPDGPGINFGQWFVIGVPFSCVMSVAIWWVLTRGFPSDGGSSLDASDIERDRRALGPVSREERIVLAIFSATALLWMFRDNIQLGIMTIPGWSNLHPAFARVEDGTVAVFLALILFVIPATGPRGPTHLLDGTVFARVPWDALLLFGGGFALSAGFTMTGLSSYLAGAFAGLEGLPQWAVVLLVCVVIAALTEMTSNVATVQMFLPVLAAWSVAQEIHPLIVMVPATIAASMAFIMPVATPPNAIVFGSGRLQIMQMARVGIWLNLIAVVVITLLVQLFLPFAFGFDASVFPGWAGK